MYQKYLCHKAGQPGEETVKLAVTWETHCRPELYEKMVEQGQKEKKGCGGNKAESGHVKIRRSVCTCLHTAWDLSRRGKSSTFGQSCSIAVIPVMWWGGAVIDGDKPFRRGRQERGGIGLPSM